VKNVVYFQHRSVFFLKRDTFFLGVGMLGTPDEVMKAFETGVPLIVLGRELLMEPQWVQKVQAAEEDKIPTTLSKKDQKELAISDKMCEYYTGMPGCLPIV
jgi:2,4-dienoyl-CoA reductase-like NADH-dependent reductase (Old Yellow Enzyme family)